MSGTGDTDNASFSISGANLLTNTALDYETKNSYSMLVQTSDGTATYSKTFTISITDVDEDSDGDGITNNSRQLSINSQRRSIRAQMQTVLEMYVTTLQTHQMQTRQILMEMALEM